MQDWVGAIGVVILTRDEYMQREIPWGFRPLRWTLPSGGYAAAPRQGRLRPWDVGLSGGLSLVKLYLA